MELESEIQSLQKANLNLENLLEATKVCNRQEVSQLSKIHAETLKVGNLKLKSMVSNFFFLTFIYLLCWVLVAAFKLLVAACGI